MIVKILKKSATFKAVSYNTGKVDKNRGELLLVKNFGVLQGMENLRPQDYINYLEAVSSRSTRIRYPQFHVAISTKGRLHSKEELADIAQKWMQGMGYGEQPYLLIFHKDTANNHVHLVSTRVGKDGKKISDRYEKLRAYRVLNQVMGEDEKQALANHLQKALSYNFSTRAQFKMLLEMQGYALTLKDNGYSISKYGRQLDSIDISTVDDRIASRQKDSARVGQIRAFIEKYRPRYDPSVEHTGAGYRSALAEFLHGKFGLQIIFHGKDGKPPYGYTLIDHAKSAVYKGGEIMPLKEFIAKPQEQDTRNADKKDAISTERPEVRMADTDLPPWEENPDSGGYAEDKNYGYERTRTIGYTEPDTEMPIPTLDINISDDIDDEAILGRNRRRQRKARTNTR